MNNAPDPVLTKILEELKPEHNLGVLLAAQMGGTPQEIQLILETTEYDEEKEALKPTGQYIIRAVGVLEQKLSLGLFNNLVLSTDSPILYRHNENIVQVYFKGQAQNIDALMLDLYQLYGQTYGQYRSMADEVNRSRPLGSLLSQEYGLLGEMPLPFAEKVKPLLARYNLEASYIESEDHRPPFKFQLLVMDDSYIIAQMFSSDPMGKPKAENQETSG